MALISLGATIRFNGSGEYSYPDPLEACRDRVEGLGLRAYAGVSEK